MSDYGRREKYNFFGQVCKAWTEAELRLKYWCLIGPSSRLISWLYGVIKKTLPSCGQAVVMSTKVGVLLRLSLEVAGFELLFLTFITPTF